MYATPALLILWNSSLNMPTCAKFGEATSLLATSVKGDIPFFRKLGAERGFSVELVEAMVEVQGDWVSSSRIRNCLQAGNVAEVNLCLGRPFHVSGEVVKGDQRGRTIGFPTANLDAWDELLLPAKGVYATYAWVGDTRYIAATNVGNRPTVNGRSVTVEAHLLDFEGDLYGQNVRVEFIHHIRPEKSSLAWTPLQPKFRLMLWKFVIA